MYKLYNATVFNAVKKRQGKLRGGWIPIKKDLQIRIVYYR